MVSKENPLPAPDMALVSIIPTVAHAVTQVMRAWWCDGPLVATLAPWNPSSDTGPTKSDPMFGSSSSLGALRSP